MKEAWESSARVVANVLRAVERAREHRVPVIWAQHSDDQLLQGSAANIALSGAATGWCIRATAYAALERGYDLTLIEDAHTTETVECVDGARVEAASVIRDPNAATKWLSHPDRATRTAAAGAVDFAGLR